MIISGYKSTITGIKKVTIDTDKKFNFDGSERLVYSIVSETMMPMDQFCVISEDYGTGAVRYQVHKTLESAKREAEILVARRIVANMKQFYESIGLWLEMLNVIEEEKDEKYPKP
jgi:hypothetical protein